MYTWFMSRTGAIVTIAITALIGLALLALIVINGQGLQTERSAAASLLIVCMIIFTVSGMLFTGRSFWKWQVAATPAYLRWERGFVIAAVLATALGLALLDDMLVAAGAGVLARIGMVTYLFGAVVVVVAETAYLSSGEWNSAQVVLYIVLAFLGQAIFGVALLQTGLVAAWAAWATIIWNLGWLLVMLIVRPREMYYPVLHHVAPLLIGIALLVH